MNDFLCTIQRSLIKLNHWKASLLLVIQEETYCSKKRNYASTLKSYNNQQGIFLFNIQDVIPSNHVSRGIDEMIESIKDEIFFSHYKGGGRSSSFRRWWWKWISTGILKTQPATFKRKKWKQKTGEENESFFFTCINLGTY